MLTKCGALVDIQTDENKVTKLPYSMANILSKRKRNFCLKIGD
jgi:hypothetical protein